VFQTLRVSALKVGRALGGSEVLVARHQHVVEATVEPAAVVHDCLLLEGGLWVERRGVKGLVRGMELRHDLLLVRRVRDGCLQGRLSRDGSRWKWVIRTPKLVLPVCECAVLSEAANAFRVEVLAPHCLVVHVWHVHHLQLDLHGQGLQE